jgi:ABC-type Mn2+/Zn2+ transport system ATPase subunit
MQKENITKNHPRVELKNVSYIVPNGTKILNSVSFSVDDLSVAIIGKNGSGKSTLLRLIIGEITPTEGSVNVNGKIGYLPQEIIRPQNL